MKLAIVLLLLLPRLALADWQPSEDVDCSCDRALPGTPDVTVQPSPWSDHVWQREEVRVSPTEWYAVSFINFGKLPAKALDAALAGLHGKVVSRKRGKQQLDARVKLGDGTTVAVRFIVQGDRIYALEAGDVARGTRPDPLFAGFRAWTGIEVVAHAVDSPVGNAITGIAGGSGEYGADLGFGSGHGRAPGPPGPSVRVGPIEVQSGLLEPAFVRRWLVRAHDKLLACYQKRLADVPKLGTGDVHVQLTIEGSGKPSQVTAKDFDDAIDRCVEHTIRQIEWPHSSDGKPTTVTTTLGFRPAP